MEEEGKGEEEAEPLFTAEEVRSAMAAGKARARREKATTRKRVSSSDQRTRDNAQDALTAATEAAASAAESIDERTVADQEDAPAGTRKLKRRRTKLDLSSVIDLEQGEDRGESKEGSKGTEGGGSTEGIEGK